MYAIIVTSGRQQKVEEGDEVTVDLRAEPVGSQIRFDRVLAIGTEAGTRIGRPTIDGASVTAEIVRPVQGPKLVVQKMRRRKNSRRKTGHRQLNTVIRINRIEAGA